MCARAPIHPDEPVHKRDRVDIGEPKTTRSRRQVALSRVSVQALERRRTVQISERLKAGPEWEDTGVVFTNELGRPIEPGNSYAARTSLC